MSALDPAYRTLYLQQEYQKRLARNPAYSLRSFSKKVKLSPAFLSYLMRGQRTLSLEQFFEIRTLLRSPLGAPAAKKTTKRKAPLSDDMIEKKAAEFADQLDWVDILISDLTLVDGFKADVVWIGEQLNISSTLVTASIEKMIALNYLNFQNEKLKKTRRKVFISTEASLKFIRDYHSEMMKRATEFMTRTDAQSFSERLITGGTFAVNADDIPAIKQKMAAFIQEVVGSPSHKKRNSLYQLNLQLVPLVKPKKTVRSL